MGSKRHPKIKDFDPDPYSDYDFDVEEGLDDIGDLAGDFYSADWEDPQGSEKKISARRKIERRNEFKALHSQFDDWDDDLRWERDW